MVVVARARVGRRVTARGLAYVKRWVAKYVKLAKAYRGKL